MASLEMNGPYDFTTNGIDNAITKKSTGNYGLGYVDNNSKFIVQYVGRSDIDVGQELKNYLSKKYKKFKYSYATSPKTAFEKECKNYHDFGENKELDNKIHPDRPKNTDWKCPSCKQFD